MHSSTLAESTKALKWAEENAPYTQNKLVKEDPWSRIYKLNNDSKTTYLKLVPPNQPHILKTIERIAAQFNSSVPHVIAVNKTLGLQLEKHHGGIELNSASSQIQKHRLLSTYAKIQSEAAKKPEFLASIPSLNVEKLTDGLINFFKTSYTDESDNNSIINADYFLGKKDSKEYYDVLCVRKNILKDFLTNADLLPPTLNHCDLQTTYAAERHDGSIVIYDWDNALIGPAGLSLPKFFGKAFDIYRHFWGLLEDTTKTELHSKIKLMDRYVDELAENGYAKKSSLIKSIPASACAGVMQGILRYCRPPADNNSGVYSNAYDELTNGMDDILNICDYLSCSNRNDALHLAQDYLDRGILFRAIYIYRQYVKTHPNDSKVQYKLAIALNNNGQWEEAISCFKAIIDQNPADVRAINDYGLTLLRNGRPEHAIGQFEIALSIQPEFEEAKTNVERAEELLEMKDQAGRPNKLPTLRVSTNKELKEGVSDEKINLACSLFNKYGALQLENVFDKDLIKEIKTYILDKYQSYFFPKEYDDCLILGNKRHMVTLDIDGPINSPELYDNPTMTAVAKKILGDDFIMGSVNIAVALPGAPHQSVHREHPPLFKESDRFRHDTPCYAIAILIPLIKASPVVGTTLVIKESQNMSFYDTENSDLPSQAYFLDLGSCIMVDYKVWHQGLANNSEDTIRPLLTVVFQRSWFYDRVNYTKQPPIKIDDSVYKKAPERLKELVSWYKQKP